MNENYIPQRKCIVCNKRFSKNELFRIVRTSDGSIKSDTKSDGRGAYICKNRECADGFVKKGSISRSFKTKVSKENQTLIAEELELWLLKE